MNKVLVTVREFHLATTLVLCYSDGSVEFRSRSTLECLLRDVADRVSSLAQVGLDYLPGDPRECDSRQRHSGVFPNTSKFYTQRYHLVHVPSCQWTKKVLQR